MFKYFGAKRKIARHYPAPTEAVIIEPFAGSAGYAVAHRRVADRVLLIEKDRRVVDLWHRLLATSAPDLLATPDPVAGDLSDDLLVAFAAGRTTRDTPARFVVSPRMAQRYRPMLRHIASVLDECRHFEVRHGDYTDAPAEKATWFIDAPYQHQGGRPDRSRGGRYHHANAALNYDALSAWVQARRGQVIACDQEGATWLPWNGRIAAADNTHREYGEVFWHRPAPVSAPAQEEGGDE